MWPRLKYDMYKLYQSNAWTLLSAQETLTNARFLCSITLLKKKSLYPHPNPNPNPTPSQNLNSNPGCLIDVELPVKTHIRIKTFQNKQKQSINYPGHKEIHTQ